MKNNIEADVRTDTGIKVAALFFAAMMFLAFTTDPIRTGTQEGDRAPALTGMAYNGSGWSTFEMSDYLTTNWTAGDAEGQWMVVEFMDTDCPYCVRSAGEVGRDADYFTKRSSLQAPRNWTSKVMTRAAPKSWRFETNLERNLALANRVPTETAPLIISCTSMTLTKTT